MAIPPDGLRIISTHTHTYLLPVLYSIMERNVWWLQLLPAFHLALQRNPAHWSHYVLQKGLCQSKYVFYDVMWNVMIYGIINTIWYNKIPYLRVCTAYILLGRGLMAISSAWLCRLGSLQKSERKGQKGPTGKNLGRSRNKTSLELAREREGEIFIW